MGNYLQMEVAFARYYLVCKNLIWLNIKYAHKICIFCHFDEVSAFRKPKIITF